MNKGSKHTLEARKEISLNNAHSMLGKRPWNWGLTKETDERVRMQSESIKGRKITTEQKKKISNANKGREKTREEKLKISIALKKRFENKENHPMYGKPRPKELMKRIGLKNKGRKNSKDAIKRMSKSQKLRYVGGEVVWNKGKKLSEEHIKNLSISHLGHIPWNKGKKGVYSKEIIERFRKSREKQIFPKKDTSIEIKIQNFLKKLNIDFFTHQYIKEIEHGYQCDIFIPSKNLVIECDGCYWHKYPIGNDIDYIRTKELIEKGFKVLRLWEHDINSMRLIDFKIKLNKIGGKI